MIRKIIFTVLVILLGVSGQPVWAGSNGADGFVGGAIGGALLGQAIGRDTEATLVGTAVGGMLGYIIGNEHDKMGSARHTVRHRRVRERPRYRVPEPVCREAEVMAYVDGHPERIWTTVCQENGEWVIAEDMSSWERTSISNPGWRHRPPRWERHRHPRRDWCHRNCDRRHRRHHRDCNSHRGRHHRHPHGSISVEVRAPIF